jgi:hypothetical protein
MNRHRVAHLVDNVLPNIDPATLNMRQWRCGTMFCAFGHAANDAIFQAQGLHWGKNDGTPVPAFNGFTDIGAAAEFFGIDYATARDWFLPSHYNQRPIRLEDVIARIQESL